MSDNCIMNPERECIGAAAAAKLETRIEHLESWQQESKKFHNTFYDWQREQIDGNARIDERLKSIESNLGKLVSWQEEQKEKPNKRWEAIVDKLIWAILAAVVAFLLAKIGL